jgi:hypothetical protein
MFTVDTYVTFERRKDFLFTTPFVVEKYGALMKRPTTFLIDSTGVTAGINIGILVNIFHIFHCRSGIYGILYT